MQVNRNRPNVIRIMPNSIPQADIILSHRFLSVFISLKANEVNAIPTAQHNIAARKTKIYPNISILLHS